MKFVFDSAKLVRSSDHLIEPATKFSSPIFRTHSHGYNFFIKFYSYGIGLSAGKCASILFTIFIGGYDNLLQWLFSKLVYIGIRDQLDSLTPGRKQFGLIKTRPTRNPQSQQKQEFRQSTSITLFLTLNSLVKLKVF